MTCKTIWCEKPTAKPRMVEGIFVTPRYCEEHEGANRSFLEMKMEAERATAAAKKNLGIGGGLSKNRKETDNEREARLKAEQARKQRAAKNRAEREKKQKDARPKNQGGQQDEGGNGTSRKARQKAKKRHPGSQFYRSSNYGVAVKQKQ